MGCDIHVVLERRKRDSTEWIGVWASDELPGGRPRVCRRDYDFFGHFNVRSTVQTPIYPRNIPEDVSRLAWAQYMQAPTDHHSPSYATPQEFVERWLLANPDDQEVRRDCALWDLLRLDTDFDGDHRVVFWFDN